MNAITEAGAVMLAPRLAQPEAGIPLAQFIRIRRDLHANPELGFREHRTAAMVARLLSGCYFFVGNGLAGQPGGCMVHHPGYDFNDHIIAPVSRFWAALVDRYLTAGQLESAAVKR
jgi:metal-dependent amidase/aminoacylase/carboxypeptidase family protein